MSKPWIGDDGIISEGLNQETDPLKLCASLCELFASKVVLPSVKDVDAKSLLWALTGNESSYGVLAVPRFELAYARSGKYHNAFLKKEFKLWGDWVACSYGPFQVMYVNCFEDGASTPWDLMKFQRAFHVSIAFLNGSVARQYPPDVAAVFDTWNSGNWRDTIVPQKYIEQGLKRYEHGWPNILS